MATEREIVERLTERQRQIGERKAQGLNTQAIANDLCLSPRTIETHWTRARQATGLESAPLILIIARPLE